MADRLNPFGLEGLARVTVFGAGVTGLTVAHELVRRGFEVRVIEPEMEIDRLGVQRVATGGMARSQWARIPRVVKDRGQPRRRMRRAQLLTENSWFRVSIEFPPGSDRPLDGQLRRLQERCETCEVVRRRSGETETLPLDQYDLRVLGFADDLATDGENVALADRRVKAVTRFLNGIGVSGDRIGTYAWGNREQAPRELPEAREIEVEGIQRRDHNRFVTVDLDEARLAGEHGFRFFPSFYNHLFNSMTRTPIRDREGRETERSVFDNLCETRVQAFVREGVAPMLLPRLPAFTARAMRESTGSFFQMGYRVDDIVYFVLRLLRFMTSSPQRRRERYERISWWEFISGKEKPDDPVRWQYGDVFRKHTMRSGRVLAAFDAENGDACTLGTILVQLVIDHLRDTPTKVDATLNGPTSDAWFRHWRRELEFLGVEFEAGRLRSLRRDNQGRIVPLMGASQDPAAWVIDTDPSHYFVMATDAVTAEMVTAQLPPVGAVRQLRGYTTVATDPVTRAPRRRSPMREPGLTRSDRFQTLSGIQFFFTRDVKWFRGHLYYVDAEWALTSINQPQFWSRKPNLRRDGHQGILSVDIGEFRVDSLDTHKTAWNSSADEIAKTVWGQIKRSLRTSPEREDPLLRGLPEPAWYHIDSGLTITPDRGVIRNAFPYLIPIKDDWSSRPGTEPWDPGREGVVPHAEPGCWSHPGHGGYCVHWDQLVFAGTYCRTFTRLTSMESANESARHAVNALMDHILYSEAAAPLRARQPGLVGWDPKATEPVANLPTSTYATGGDEAEPVYYSTPIGDYCQIWNPEEYEFEPLMEARDLDRLLYKQGYPHVFDLMGVEALVPLIVPWVSLMTSPLASEKPVFGDLSVAELLRRTPAGDRRLFDALERQQRTVALEAFELFEPIVRALSAGKGGSGAAP